MTKFENTWVYNHEIGFLTSQKIVFVKESDNMKNYTLSVEEIRELARMERKMDSGEQPYVVHQDIRTAVDPSLMNKPD